MYDPRCMWYRFAIRNQHLQLGGVSEDAQYTPEDVHKHGGGPPIVIRDVGHAADVRLVMHNGRMFGVNPMECSKALVDMTPSVELRSVHSLEDLFPWNIKQQEQIAIESKADMEVVDLLEKILADQRPKQQEIWQRRSKVAVSEKPERQTLLRIV